MSFFNIYIFHFQKSLTKPKPEIKSNEFYFYFFDIPMC